MSCDNLAQSIILKYGITASGIVTQANIELKTNEAHRALENTLYPAQCGLCTEYQGWLNNLAVQPRVKIPHSACCIHLKIITLESPKTLRRSDSVQ